MMGPPAAAPRADLAPAALLAPHLAGWSALAHALRLQQRRPLQAAAAATCLAAS
jgi:hypothetical protein